MKKCPYCGKENPDDATVCMIDQQPLAPKDKAPALIRLSREEGRAHLAARPLAVKFAVSVLAIHEAFDLVREIVKYLSRPSRYLYFYLSTFVTLSLMALLLYFVFRGKNWARWLVMCSIVLGTLLLFVFIRQLQWDSYFYTLLDIVAVAALFQRSSNEWYAKSKKTSEQPLPAS